MRRSALPSVTPKPRSSGSATTVAMRLASLPALTCELVRPDQFLPILLDHVVTYSTGADAMRHARSHPPCGEDQAAADAPRTRLDI